MNVAADPTMIKRVLPTLNGLGARIAARWPTLRPFVPHLVGVGVVCGLGLAVAGVTIFAPLPANLTQDRWTLIQWEPYKAGPLRDEMMNARLWGETPGAKVEAAAPVAVVPQWRFVGTAASGKSRVAVIEIDATKIQRFGAGDVLPNGARIESVGSGEIVVADGGASRTIKLFDADKATGQPPPADGKPPAK